MPTIILFSAVQGDGVGDFYHLTDVCRSIRNNEKLKDYTLIPFISYDRMHSEKTIHDFKKILNALEVTESFFYVQKDKDEGFEHDPRIQKHVQNAEQIISISYYWHFPEDFFKKYARKDVIYKYIGEHETDTARQGTIDCSLGLDWNKHGIKLRRLGKISVEQAFSVFEKEDPQFADTLLMLSNEKDAKAWPKNLLHMGLIKINMKTPILNSLNFLVMAVMNRRLYR